MNQKVDAPVKELGEVSLLIYTLLADEYLLYAKTRYAQRDIKRSNFNGLSKFFDSQFEVLDMIIDNTTERVHILGRSFPDSLHDFLKTARLPKQDEEFSDQDYIIKSLLKEHESIISLLHNDIITIGEVHKDSDTAAFLSELMKQHEKIVWMLESHT